MTVRKGALVCAAAAGLLLAGPVNAQTLRETLSAAYSTNPTLNVARSSLRSIDENIAIARSRNRPTVTANLSQSLRTTRTIGSINSGSRSGPTAVQVRIAQPLFAGFQVRNSIRAAEAAVKAERKSLENTEQNVLLDSATAFYDVLLNREVVRLRQSDVAFLSRQTTAARDRFEVGEGTRTDVSQAEARRAEAQSLLDEAIANLSTTEATYRQLTGLTAGNLVDNINEARLLPPTLNAAVTLGQNRHPAILAALFAVDQQLYNVSALEGQFLPSLTLNGSAGTTFNSTNRVSQSDDATLSLDLTVPIYQGGRVSAEVRQAKENLGTQRIQVDLTRDDVRQFTVSSWANYTGALRSIQNSRTGVFAANLALQGVIEEQKVGQRTTLDVLDAQRDLISAQLTLVLSERDSFVAAFTLMSSIGSLSAERLGLRVSYYRPAEHTDQVRDKWFGFRTPDGR
ncbi:TolC family outer membrane protein [Acuticoccus sp. MNP-M23]|uniref:TolC family outer membrane protein n=1 Tax=Acuticoccus sp. MNP-M23 TaxID=3072793 RepID=UPI0028153D62|nr:TolC family outer membrane protein [Acuticoccus sp. MNP-M23]WMS41778.1 TolC family outer membrane protein [Acuticoccus sp. MNP-M23]